LIPQNINIILVLKSPDHSCFLLCSGEVFSLVVTNDASLTAILSLLSNITAAGDGRQGLKESSADAAALV